MNYFTKEELQMIYEDFKDTQHSDISEIAKFMIDNYCEHEWRCWDDQHNTRECMKCGEKRTGEIND